MPAIVVEDFDLTKSNKHEEKMGATPPFLMVYIHILPRFDFLENVMLHVYISTTNVVQPLSKV